MEHEAAVEVMTVFSAVGFDNQFSGSLLLLGVQIGLARTQKLSEMQKKTVDAVFGDVVSPKEEFYKSLTAMHRMELWMRWGISSAGYQRWGCRFCGSY